MDLNCVRRITLKAADLDTEPVTENELEQLRKKLENIRKNQREVKAPDYSKHSKEKLIQILTDREKEHRKVETFYRTQVDELEAELCDARELIISLIDERNEVDSELSTIRKQRQEFKGKIQNLELELSKKALENLEISHKLELAGKQTYRYSQQLQEEQQKIDVLNSQITALQEALVQAKGDQQDLKNELEKSAGEQENLNKIISKMQVDMNELKKHREFAENLTDKNLKDAITNLAMIILGKDKAYTLTPEQKYLINQAFGENCSKIIESANLRYQELENKYKTVRDDYTSMANLADQWIQEYILLCDWLEKQNNLLLEGEFDKTLENFSDKQPEITAKSKEAAEISNDPDTALILVARLSVKEKEESISLGKPLYGKYTNSGEELEKLHKKLSDQKKELEEVRNKLHEAYSLEIQMRDEITELTNSISSLKKNGPKVEIMRFLQCQASIVEDLIADQYTEQGINDSH